MLGGKVALVTGAAGGIGRAIALALARSGADIAVHFNTGAARAERLRAEIRDLAREAECFACDVGESAATRALVGAVEARFGRLDILVNNAGIAFSRVPLVDIDTERWERLFRVNLHGPFFLCKWVLPGMRARRWGRIVNIGSAAVKVNSPGAAAYIASKAALSAMTAVLAKEEGRHGILVNTVAPSFTNTEMGRKALARRSPDEAQDFRRAVPLQRFCEPEDVANLVAFLASEQAGYISGQTYYVNGGDRIETFNFPEKIFAGPGP